MVRVDTWWACRCVKCVVADMDSEDDVCIASAPQSVFHTFHSEICGGDRCVGLGSCG